jgi:signal transduction histidine kinase
MLTVPVAYRDETLGCLTLFFADNGRRHTVHDLTLAEELCRRAAAAIVNARLFKEARDAIGVRDDFLSMAGHELRTPLTALQLQILSISKMVMQPDSAEKVAARADKAGRNVLRLSGLVNELLDISRISAGRLKLERAPMDLAEAVRDVLTRHAEELAKNGCALNFVSEGDMPGSWDRARVEQIVHNLLTNAIKYGKGKPIDVTLVRDEHVVRMVVADHGIGISPEDQLRVFQRFERAVSSRHFGGLGLGLWIARQLVDAHGGTIRVSSEPGSGATFEVELPAVPPDEVRA